MSGDHAGHRHAEHGHGEAKMEDLVTGKFPLDHEFILEAAEEKEALLSPVYTFFAFVFTCCSLPFVFSVYFGVNFCRRLWLKHLQRKFPDLEFVKRTSLRTAMDTIRNQGIVTVLLQVKGSCNVALFRQKIQEEILNKRHPNGRLCFPHLTCKLTSRYGRYAWKTTVDFNIENHILVANTTQYKGRSVSEDNIQEFVSDIVSKYLPTDIPPWQITIIPVTSSDEERSYILIRIHHILLSEDNIKLGHLLMLQRTREDEDTEQDWPLLRPDDERDLESIQAVLESATVKPAATVRLYERFCESLTNAWNELVYQYDPLENPCVLKAPTLFNYAILCLISGVYVIKDYCNSGKHAVEAPSIRAIARKELKRRKVNFRLLQKCVYNTINPFNVFLRSISITWYINTSLLIRCPLFFLSLLRDLNGYLQLGGLVLRSLREMAQVLGVVYKIPRVLMDEMMFSILNEHLNQLQTVSLCGRKVVNWSEPVNVSVLKQVQHDTGALPCEILAYALTASVQTYFEKNGYPLPKKVHTTVRFISQEDILKTNKRLSNGILCFDLPLHIPKDDPLYSLNITQYALHNTLIKQSSIYLASSLRLDLNLLTYVLPSVAVRFLLYLLTRHYSVTITQVEGNFNETKRKKLLWGQEIENIIYWRPPQANISLSLTLMCYGEEVRLGTMADAELMPHHLVILKEFPQKINQLASAAALLRQHYSSSLSSLDMSTASDSSLHLDFSE
ncbi:uncharacterized protein [Bemisia tabaci]